MNFSPGIIGADALLCLGACLIRQTRLDEAETVFRQLEQDAKSAPVARANLATIRDLRRTGRH